MLGTTSAITAAELVRALYETGYGKQGDWSNFLNFSNREKIELFNFLISRINFVLRVITFSNGTISPRSFTNIIDASEWGTIAYYLGQAGARISADRWIAHSRTVKRALHISLYTNEAFLNNRSLMRVFLRGKKTPDLLVEDNIGDWHVFEAKAGQKSYRDKAVTKGLAQLDSVLGVGVGYGSRYTCNAPKSSVCSFALLDRGGGGKGQLSFDVVDPPIEPPKDALKKAQKLEEGSEIRILPDVAETRSAVLSAYIIQQHERLYSSDGRIIRKGPLPGIYIVDGAMKLESVEKKLIIFDAIRKKIRLSVVENDLSIFSSKDDFYELLLRINDEMKLRVRSATRISVINSVYSSYEPTFEMDSPEYRLLAIIAKAIDFQNILNFLRMEREKCVGFAYSFFVGRVEAVFPAQSGGVFVQVKSDG